MSDESFLYGTPPPEDPPPETTPAPEPEPQPEPEPELGLESEPEPKLAGPAYPVRFDIDAPAEVSRLSTAFRLILLIPLAIAVSIIGTGGWFTPYLTVGFGLSGALVAFHWITILVRGRPVGWVFDVLVAMQRFILRANTYFMLITDKYPPFEGEWSVSYDVDMPERIQRRKLFFWKTLASIPHFILLFILWFAVAVCVVIAWFAILFTGRYPLGLRGFVIGWLRWSARVNAYWMSLRDDFPPFSMSAEVSRGSRTAHVVSGVGGFALAGGAVAAIAVALIATASTEKTDVSYASLLNGTPSETVEILDIEVTLLGAIDPYQFPDGLFVPEEDGRFVAFGVDIFNLAEDGRDIYEHDFLLKDEFGKNHDPLLTSFGGLQGPRQLEGDSGATIVVIFEIPDIADPTRLEYEPQFLQKARFEFID